MSNKTKQEVLNVFPLSCSYPSFIDKGKFLLAARRYRRGSHTEYIISLDAGDISQESNAYVGKLSQPPHSGAKPASRRSSRCFASKQISPQVPARNFEVGQVSYRFNLLKSRGPRRMICLLNCPASGETGNSEMKKPDYGGYHNTVLRNKAPRWHDQLQCWCLNCHVRVTVASVKNFQLVVALDPKGDDETILQFAKVGDVLYLPANCSTEVELVAYRDALCLYEDHGYHGF